MADAPTRTPTLTSFPVPPTPAQAFRFLDLPLELREQVYELYFRPADRLQKSSLLEGQGFYGGVYAFEFGLYRTCKQIAREAKKVWRRSVMTVKVATPWPSAVFVNHISSEGLVPIVCTDRRADAFNDHHALIQITAPFHQADHPEYAVVLLLDDLHLFTQTWYYSALAYPMLNDRLSTAFILRDPDMDEDSAPNVPLALQRALLLPFSQIKGLYSMQTEGFHKTVAHELRTAMSIPPPTLQQSCELATTLLYTGDAHLAHGEQGASAALEHYTAAFHAIHILIKGRTRRVLADTFFHATITAGRYAHQTGMMVRVILRLKLVSRIMRALLLQRNWSEAAFWGMRSVRIMSDALDSEFEDFLADLVGGDDVGMLYVRTGIALWMLRQEEGVSAEQLEEYADDLADTRGLFVTSRKHFKRGMAGVRAELDIYGLPWEWVRVFDDAEPALSEAGYETMDVDPMEQEHVGWGAGGGGGWGAGGAGGAGAGWGGVDGAGAGWG